MNYGQFAIETLIELYIRWVRWKNESDNGSHLVEMTSRQSQMEDIKFQFQLNIKHRNFPQYIWCLMKKNKAKKQKLKKDTLKSVSKKKNWRMAFNKLSMMTKLNVNVRFKGTWSVAMRKIIVGRKFTKHHFVCQWHRLLGCSRIMGKFTTSTGKKSFKVFPL